MTDLETLVEPLKRELAVPGTFEDTYPDTDDVALLDSLKDGFGEAQLNGFFADQALTGATNQEVEPDLSLAGGTLIVLVTAARIIRSQVRAMATLERYKAGSVEYEVQRAATLLRDELAFVNGRIEKLVEKASAATSVYVLDAFPGRVFYDQLGGFYAYEALG